MKKRTEKTVLYVGSIKPDAGGGFTCRVMLEKVGPCPLLTHLERIISTPGWIYAGKGPKLELEFEPPYRREGPRVVFPVLGLIRAARSAILTVWSPALFGAVKNAQVLHDPAKDRARWKDWQDFIDKKHREKPGLSYSRLCELTAKEFTRKVKGKKTEFHPGSVKRRTVNPRQR